MACLRELIEEHLVPLAGKVNEVLELSINATTNVSGRKFRVIGVEQVLNNGIRNPDKITIHAIKKAPCSRGFRYDGVSGYSQPSATTLCDPLYGNFSMSFLMGSFSSPALMKWSKATDAQ